MLSYARPALAVSLIVLVGGCAAETAGADSALASSSSFTSGDTIRLYEGLGVPFGRCDVGTDLVFSVLAPNESARVTRSGTSAHASLRASVPRDCESAGSLDADRRSYDLLYAGEDCGSSIYVASMTTEGKARSITITDHRGRLCRDRVPSTIVVEEESSTKETRTLYARDPSEVSCELRGKRYAAASSFRDECNVCTCTPHGEVTCTAMACLGADSDF